MIFLVIFAKTKVKMIMKMTRKYLVTPKSGKYCSSPHSSMLPFHGQKYINVFKREILPTSIEIEYCERLELPLIDGFSMLITESVKLFRSRVLPGNFLRTDYA
jgi:hypothetical protein